MAHSSLSKAEQLAEARQRVRDAFIIFETKEGSKMVDIKDIPTLLRCLGVNPTTAQIVALQERLAVSTHDTNTTSSSVSSPPTSSLLALEHCEAPIASWLLETAPALVRDDFHLLLRAFKALDPDGRGWLDAQQLRAALTGAADGLSTDEANAMLDAAADDQGRVMYQEYALRLASDGRPM